MVQRFYEARFKYLGMIMSRDDEVKEDANRVLLNSMVKERTIVVSFTLSKERWRSLIEVTNKGKISTWLKGKFFEVVVKVGLWMKHHIHKIIMAVNKNDGYMFGNTRMIRQRKNSFVVMWKLNWFAKTRSIEERFCIINQQMHHNV